MRVKEPRGGRLPALLLIARLDGDKPVPDGSIVHLEFRTVQHCQWRDLRHLLRVGIEGIPAGGRFTIGPPSRLRPLPVAVFARREERRARTDRPKHLIVLCYGAFRTFTRCPLCMSAYGRPEPRIRFLVTRRCDESSLSTRTARKKIPQQCRMYKIGRNRNFPSSASGRSRAIPVTGVINAP